MAFKKSGLPRVSHLRRKYAETLAVIAHRQNAHERLLRRLDGAFDYVLAMDPTPKAIYLSRILEWVRDGVVRLEDARQVRTTLARFHEEKRHLALELRDIGRYATPGDITATLAPVQEAAVRSIPPLALEGTKVAAAGAGWAIYEVSSEPAAQFWGDGTGWCTRHPATARDYLAKAPLYVLVAGNAKFQWHVPSKQLMDRYDRPARLLAGVPKEAIEAAIRIVSPEVPEGVSYCRAAIYSDLLVAFKGSEDGAVPREANWISLDGRTGFDLPLRKSSDGLLEGFDDEFDLYWDPRRPAVYVGDRRTFIEEGDLTRRGFPDDIKPVIASFCRSGLSRISADGGIVDGKLDIPENNEIHALLSELGCLSKNSTVVMSAGKAFLVSIDVRWRRETGSEDDAMETMDFLFEDYFDDEYEDRWLGRNCDVRQNLTAVALDDLSIHCAGTPAELASMDRHARAACDIFMADRIPTPGLLLSLGPAIVPRALQDSFWSSTRHRREVVDTLMRVLGPPKSNGWRVSPPAGSKEVLARLFPRRNSLLRGLIEAEGGDWKSPGATVPALRQDAAVPALLSVLERSGDDLHRLPGGSTLNRYDLVDCIGIPGAGLLMAALPEKECTYGLVELMLMAGHGEVVQVAPAGVIDRRLVAMVADRVDTPLHSPRILSRRAVKIWQNEAPDSATCAYVVDRVRNKSAKLIAGVTGKSEYRDVSGIAEGSLAMLCAARDPRVMKDIALALRGLPLCAMPWELVLERVAGRPDLAKSVREDVRANHWGDRKGRLADLQNVATMKPVTWWQDVDGENDAGRPGLVKRFTARLASICRPATRQLSGRGATNVLEDPETHHLSM